MSLRLATALATAAAVSVPADVFASTPASRVLVLPVEIDGDVGDDERARLNAALERGLERGALTFVSDAEAPACSDKRCIRKRMGDVGASLAVQTSVRVHDRVYEFELRIVEGDDLKPRARAEDSCEICGVEEVAERLADQAAILAHKVQEVVAHPRLRVEAQPRGVRVYLDDALVGTTPLELEVEPGSHTVRLEADGHIAQERRIEGRPGVEERVAARLQPVPKSASGSRRGRTLVGLGAAGLGLGLAAVGTGVPLLVLDGRQNQRQCAGENVDVNGTCRWTYATMTGGVVALAAGGALAAAGALLLAFGLRDRNGAEHRSAVRLRPAGAGLTLRF